MKARGNIKKIIKIVGEIQNKIGMAQRLHENDVNLNAHEQAQQLLREAFDLCVEITSSYEPVE